MTILLWNEEGPPPPGDWITVLWSSFGEKEKPDCISIPALVEEHAITLRSRYLAMIFELGETMIDGKRIVDHLELRPGFSFWWMTLLVEKSSYKSQGIFEVIRLLALEELITKLKPVKIVISGLDKPISLILIDFFRKKGIEFECKRTQKKDKLISPLIRIFRSFPYPIQTVSFLLNYIRERWPLKMSINRIDTSFPSEITFVDSLIHLDKNAILTGRFASNYWTELIGAFEESKTKVNWLHLYVPHDSVTSSNHAEDLVAQFNQHAHDQEFHSMLDCSLSFSLVFSSFRDYLRIAGCSLRLGKIKHSFHVAGSDLNFWPLFKRDWFHSVRGPTAMRNCFVLNLFENSLNKTQHQKMGAYLQENQGWEMAFIHAWRSAGHGNLIGVPHSTIRFWDLRYYSDPRSYRRDEKNNLPMPDKVALNGPVAMNEYHIGIYPSDQIVQVEALRYLYLTDKNDFRQQKTNLSASPKVLICGDIEPAVNHKMLSCLVFAANEMPADTYYIVKPHPACRIIASDYSSLKLQFTDAPLAELLNKCDVVFSSNNTSAAVDAYCSGIPVVQFRDGNMLNLNPLRGLKRGVSVTNPSELATALCAARDINLELAEPYFYLDPKLARWRKLLDLDTIHSEKAVPI
jgi:surface carbohydrate biosynthesis protein (TIGR04326 family)